MKVILLEELKGRGGEGDVIDVATGYAVNYLFPKKIAVLATAGNLKQLELRRHNIAKREESRLDTADKLMAALEGKVLRIGAKVGEEGQLFGSITPTQIAEAIAEKFDTEVDRRKIDIHGLIKTAGQHEVTISIYRELKANMIIDVVDENAAAAEAAEAEAAEAATAADGADEAEAATDGATVETAETTEVAAEVEAATEATDAVVEVAETEAVAEEVAEVAEVAEGAAAEAIEAAPEEPASSEEEVPNQ
jgi:large subunit ribosomal protein L9